MEGEGIPGELRARSRWRLISRRGFVGGAGIAGILVLAFRRPVARLLRSTVRVGSAAAAETVPIGDHERATLMAFAHVLIPSSFVSKGSPFADQTNAVIDAALDRHATDAGFQVAAAFLDGRSVAAHQRPFTALDLPRQRELVEGLLKPYTTRLLFASPYYYFTENGRRTRHLWKVVATPIIADFYNSSLGWRVVGYSTRPGECSNLNDYQFPVSSAPVS